MLLRLLPLLRCPWCESEGLEPEPSGHHERDKDSLQNGFLRCAVCHRESAVEDGIWHAMGDGKPARSLSQLSNVVPPVPQLYEKLWRRRSLSLLSRGKTSTAEELRQLRTVMAMCTGAENVIVDVACSEGLYAREIADQTSATLLAIDHSVAFLRRAQQQSVRKQVVFIRALAQNLPLVTGSVQGVMMGGSLNEIGDWNAATHEMGRITQPGGLLFSMSLIRSTTHPGRFAQRLAQLSGVEFPTVEETIRLFNTAGFEIKTPLLNGVVTFLQGTRRAEI